MIDASQVPDVSDDELLTRYVMQSGHFRRSDKKVKPDLFMPHPYQDLSVTRYLNATIEEVLAVGENIAKEGNRTLYGRADIKAIDCRFSTLKVVKDPTPENPNHADIQGFPLDKPDQKVIALRLAAAAEFISTVDVG
jgi:hypothetical protein